MNDVSEDNNEKNENTDNNMSWVEWSFKFGFGLLCIWAGITYLPDWFPEYFDPYSCRGAAPTAETLVTNQANALGILAGLGRIEVDITVTEVRTLPKDPANPFDLQCSMTYESYNRWKNAVETDEFEYTVFRRADGKGHMVKAK